MSRVHKNGTYVNEGTYAEERWTEHGRKAIEEIDTPTSSCLNCKKSDVCVLYRGELSMLETYFGHIEDKSKWPNQPEDRGKYCKLYLPMYLQEIQR